MAAASGVPKHVVRGAHLPRRSMHRVLIVPSAVQNATVTIRDPQTLHHLLNVLRVQLGDRLDCFDGQGHRYIGTVRQRAHHHLLLTIDRQDDEPAGLLRITLAQALIQPQRFEWLIQKATELGVDRIVPVLTSRTRVQRFVHGGSPQRLGRWKRIVEQAARQCGRATLPCLEAPQPFEPLVRALGGKPAVLLTLTEAGILLGEYLQTLGGAASLTMLIGPEGDFSPDEVRLAATHGVRVARLGGTTLRSETAGLVAIALVQHAVGVL